MDRKNALNDSRSRARLYLVVLLVGLGGVVAILPTVRSQHSVPNAAKPEGRQVAAKAKKPGKRKLVRAVIRGDEQDVRKLLALGADVNENVGKDDAPITPLLAAMAMDEEKIARILIAHSADLQREYLGYTAADLANFWGQENLERRLASESRSIRKEDKASLNIDGAAWVANGLAALSEKKDEGTALGLAYIVAVYQKPGKGRVNRDDVVKQANVLRESVKGQNLDSLTLTGLGEVAYRHCTDKKVAARVAQSILVSLNTPIETTSIGPSFSIMRNILQHEMDRKRFHERTLEAVYWLGIEDKDNAGWVINEFAGGTFNASISESAEAIVAGHAARFSPAVFKLVGSDAVHDKVKIRESWTDLFREIQQGNLASIEILNRLKDEKQAALKQEKIQQTFDALDSSVYLLKTIVSFDDPKLANQIYTVGSAGIQIGKSISNFTATGTATLASSITLIGGIASGVMLIASLFDSGPSPEQIILDQITELRRDFQNLREETHARFDAIDRRLNDLRDLLVRAFNSLTLDLALAREELQSVAVQLSLMESHLLGLESHIRDYFEVGIDRSVWRQIARCLEWHKYHHDPLPYEEFSAALDTILQAATREAKDVLAAGRGLTDEELKDDRKLAAQFLTLTENGLERNIGVMRSVARKFDPDGSFWRKPLGNPVRWAIMVEAYAQLASRYPDYNERVAAAGVEEMQQFGREWRIALQSLKPVKNCGSSAVTTSLFLRLVDYYKSRADNLRRIMKARIDVYQREHVEGYDLWAGPHQTPRGSYKFPTFAMSELPICEGFDISKISVDWIYFPRINSTNLAAPSVLANQESARTIFDSPLLIAHHLQLGKIRVIGTELRGPRCRETKEELFVKLGITLQGDFNKEGKVYNLFHHPVNSVQEFRTVVRLLFGVDAKCTPDQLWQEFQRFWLAQREQAFQSFDRKSIPCDSLNAAAHAVESHFKFHREALERELRESIEKGSDGDLVDALRQLTAAKAMVDAFVTLGMAKSLTEKAELRDLLSGDIMPKDKKITTGQTRVLDRNAIEEILAEGGSLLEVARDPAWLDGPAKKLKAYFKTMPDSSEPQPLIETTMQRLAILKKLHESASKWTLPEAARKLRKSVRVLGQQ